MSDKPPGNVVTRLTPPGTAALAVVRVAGPRTAPFLDAHFSEPVRPRRCVHGLLRDGERVIDDPVVVLSEDRQSADLSLHGGAWVVDEVLALAERFGFARGDTSPATDQADLWRDVLDTLPRATTELAVRALLNQPAAWAALQARNDPTALEAARADVALAWLLTPPTVVLVGPPNAGKSTLANALAGRHMSITADLPGTTRDWVAGLVDIDGLAVNLIDTAGLRDTTDNIEAQAIARGRTQAAQADLVVLVLDLSRPLDAQLHLLEAFPRAGVVVNKADALPAWDAHAVEGLLTIARTGSGLAEVRRAIVSAFGCGDFDPTQARCWLDRQRSFGAGKP